MKHLTTVALLSASAFAAVAPAAEKAKGGAPKAEDRVAPSFTGIRSDVKPPENARVGSKSPLAEKLALLEVNQSIGLTNKSKKQISSSLSKINNSAANMKPVVDASGNPTHKNGDAIKDAAGQIVGYQQIAVTARVKEFEAYDVNPATDPDKATVRIFRVK